MLSDPDARFIPAWTPMAMLSLPEVALRSVSQPTATLKFPSLLMKSD